MDERTPDGEIQEAPPEVSVETLQAEVARLAEEAGRARGEAERNWQQFLRAAADLENYRRQAIRQREDAVAGTRRTLLAIILTVVDTLERALEHTDSDAAIADGIRLARRQVLDTLKTMGVRPMESLGQPFDPRVHEAVDVMAAPEGAAPGTIVSEIQRGYLIGEEVLRPARVRVAQ
jgi:molecular chaperone GrpE